MSEEWNLLLDAVFAPEPQAVDAWHRWRAGFAPEKPVGREAFFLLAPACDARRAELAGDPLRGKFLGMLRRSWSLRQIQRRAVLSALGALSGAGLDPLLPGLSGSLLAEMVERGSVPFEGTDVLLERGRLEAAVTLLRGSGWEAPRLPRAAALRRMLEVRSFWPLRHTSGTLLQLQWRLGPERLSGSPFSRSGTPLVLDAGRTVAVLGAADSCLHALASRPAGTAIPSFSGLVLLCFIMRDDPGILEREDLVARAADFHLALPLLWTLEFMEKRFRFPIPEALPAQLRTLLVPAKEERYWRSAFHPGPLDGNESSISRAVARLSLLWRSRVLEASPGSAVSGFITGCRLAAGFPGFLLAATVRTGRRYPDVPISRSSPGYRYKERI